MSPSSSPHQAIDTREKMLEEIRDNTRTISVKLFGNSDADAETETGRLPKVETSTRRAHVRIDAIESRMQFWAGRISLLIALLTSFGVVVFEKYLLKGMK